ncbi:MAG: hypothetical protein ACRDJX_04735 [Solirubrobacteraceae bacterium]
MTELITIPANALADVRDGLFGLMDGAGGDVVAAGDVRGRVAHPEWYAEPRQQLERTWSLLDHIGWAGPAEEKTVDFGVHGWALRQAVERFLPIIEQALGEAELTDKGLRAEGHPPIKAQTSARVEALRAFAETLPVTAAA